MKSIHNVLTRAVVGQQTAAGICQGAVYALGLIAFVVGVLRLPSLGFTQGQLVIAALLLSIFFACSVIAGTMIELLARTSSTA